MMRIVCDTNVLARAAVRPLGPARAVFISALTPPNRLILSEPMLIELDRVLHYERVRSQANLTEEEIDAFIAELREAAEEVTLPDEIPPVASDADDDLVVATAIAGKCDLICTQDRHLRHRLVQAYCATYGIRILTDTELMSEFRSATQQDADDSST